MNERTFGYLHNSTCSGVLVSFNCKSAKRDEISRHLWYVPYVLQSADHAIMHLDLNFTNTHNLTRVIISHPHHISFLHKLIRTEPILVTTNMKRTCRIKYPLIISRNTTGKDNKCIIRISITRCKSNLTISIGFIPRLIRTVPLFLILQLPTITNLVTVFLTIPAELFVLSSGL